VGAKKVYSPKSLPLSPMRFIKLKREAQVGISNNATLQAGKHPTGSWNVRVNHVDHTAGYFNVSSGQRGLPILRGVDFGELKVFSRERRMLEPSMKSATPAGKILRKSFEGNKAVALSQYHVDGVGTQKSIESKGANTVKDPDMVHQPQCIACMQCPVVSSRELLRMNPRPCRVEGLGQSSGQKRNSNLSSQRRIIGTRIRRRWEC
jgi:hypothetical protein